MQRTPEMTIDCEKTRSASLEAGVTTGVEPGVETTSVTDGTVAASTIPAASGTVLLPVFLEVDVAGPAASIEREPTVDK